jgi:hypothetical protein
MWAADRTVLRGRSDPDESLTGDVRRKRMEHLKCSDAQRGDPNPLSFY